MTTSHGLTPAAFFALDLDGGSRTDALRGAVVSYATVYRAAHGGRITVPMASALAAWSRTVPAAIAAGVAIDAALACGLTGEAA